MDTLRMAAIPVVTSALLVVLVAAGGSVAGGRPLAQPRPTAVALVGGRVYSSPTATPRNDVTVLIEGGRIISVGPRAQVRVPGSAQIVDCRNKVLVAGFQNSHVHFTEWHWPEQPHNQPPPWRRN